MAETGITPHPAPESAAPIALEDVLPPQQQPAMPGDDVLAGLDETVSRLLGGIAAPAPGASARTGFDAGLPVARTAQPRSTLGVRFPDSLDLSAFTQRLEVLPLTESMHPAALSAPAIHMTPPTLSGGSIAPRRIR
jgi:hypothetical protein